jgi:hypothetical protein
MDPQKPMPTAFDQIMAIINSLFSAFQELRKREDDVRFKESLMERRERRLEDRLKRHLKAKKNQQTIHHISEPSSRIQACWQG